MRNPVAKHSRRFNKASLQRDRKKDAKRGYQKHRPPSSPAAHPDNRRPPTQESGMPDKFCMVDLETASVGPDAAILTLGAVIFDPRDAGEIISEFYAVISPEDNDKEGRRFSGGTFAWWLTQSQEAREALFVNPRSLRHALTEFKVWYADHQPSRLWANDPDFDATILGHALRSLGIHIPWHFSATRSVRTIKELASDDDGSFPDFTDGKGTAHNALADAVKQAMQVQYAYAKLGV